MPLVDATTVFEALFAAAIVVAAAALVGSITGRAGRRLLVPAVALLTAGAVGAWVAFALDPSDELALAAAGITVAVVAAIAAVPLRRLVEHTRTIDEELAAAESRLREVASREVQARGSELERLLARSRADSLSLLEAEERRLAEERRREFAEREREAGLELSEALAAAQRRVETRLAAWSDDLERAEQALQAQIVGLRERQRELIAEAEARIAGDVERLETGTEQQRAGIVRLREELGRAAEQIVEQSTAELEEHSAERRRALHELGDRLRRRERELFERIEREETGARQRLAAGFSDLERKVLSQLERSTELAVGRYSEAASQQFADAIKAAREEAARRLARELDRAVESFARQATNVLAERLAEVGDTGVRRVEKRMTEAAGGIERQQDELVAAIEQRLGAAEQDFRRRLETIAADAEAERGVIDARLQDVSRRLDEALESARDRIGDLERPPITP